MTLLSAKILAVDDVAENLDILIRRLNRMGLKSIDQARNGVEALAAIRSKAYDLILLDIMMPELDGFGVLRALRESGEFTDLPIIVISAMNEMDAVVRCIELGAEDFLFKPFNPTLLRARVLATLEKKSLRDSTREELKRKQAELNEARSLQLLLAPPSFSGVLGEQPLRIDIVLEPAREVGGDLVDHFLVGEQLLVMLLGDVSHKGAGAAMTMARTHSMFRSLAARPDARTLFSTPTKAMDVVNAELAAGNATCTFVTFLLAVLDLNTRELAFVRAGHLPPFHRDRSGAVSRLPGRGGPPLGLVEGYGYQQEALVLSLDDALLVVTDGFTEAVDPGGELYGEERVVAWMSSPDALEPGSLQALVGQVRAFEAGLPAADDMAAFYFAFAGSNT